MVYYYSGLWFHWLNYFFDCQRHGAFIVRLTSRVIQSTPLLLRQTGFAEFISKLSVKQPRTYQKKIFCSLFYCNVREFERHTGSKPAYRELRPPTLSSPVCSLGTRVRRSTDENRNTYVLVYTRQQQLSNSPENRGFFWEIQVRSCVILPKPVRWKRNIGTSSRTYVLYTLLGKPSLYEQHGRYNSTWTILTRRCKFLWAVDLVVNKQIVTLLAYNAGVYIPWMFNSWSVKITLKFEHEGLWQFQTPALAGCKKPSQENSIKLRLLKVCGLYLTTVLLFSCDKLHPVTNWTTKREGSRRNCQKNWYKVKIYHLPTHLVQPIHTGKIVICAELWVSDDLRGDDFPSSPWISRVSNCKWNKKKPSLQQSPS